MKKLQQKPDAVVSLRLSSEMANRNRESDTDDRPTTSSHYYTVFVDTNLDTHLALIVSDTDTVSDLKKKIVSEHPQCFPNFGEIKIHALKVKRKRYFYHLPDSMLVKSAFEGVKKSWFLSVDALSLKQHGDNQISSKSDASNQLALICFTEPPSGVRNNHLPDSPSKGLSLLDTSPVPQPESIQYTYQKVPSIDPSGQGDSCKEVSKDLEMEVKHVTDDTCENLSADSKWRSDFEMEKYVLPSEGNKIPETNSEHKVGNSQVGVNDDQYNNSPEVSLRTMSALKKKSRSKKKSNDAVSKGIVKATNASVVASDIYASHSGIVGPGDSSGNTGKKLLNDMEMANTDVGKEPCKTSPPDTDMLSDSGEIPRTHVEGRNDKSRNMIDDVHCNDSVEASKSGPAEKKKRKREGKAAGNPSEENKALLSNFSKETSKPEAIIPENFMEEKQKTTAATSDCLFTEPPINAHLVASSSSGKKKRKKKNKLPRDQVATNEPSSLHDAGEESFKENVEIVVKDSDEASDVIVSEQNIQHATLPGTFGVYEKQKHPEPVQEVVEGDKLTSSSISIDASRPNAAIAKGKSDAPELSAGSGSKGTKNSKKHRSTNVKELPPLVVNEFDNLKKDVIVTHNGHENVVPDDHKVETSYPDKIEEQRELPQNCDPEAMLSDKCEPLIQGEADMRSKGAVVSTNLLDTNIIMESGISADSRRMKKRVKKSAATKQVMSSMECADNSASDISSIMPRSTFNVLSSGDAKKEERFLSETRSTKISKPKTVDNSFIGATAQSDDMGGNEAESLSLTQVNNTQGNPENIDGNLRKKAKKNQSSDAKTFADFPVIEQANEVESLQVNQINTTRKNAENMDEKSIKKTKKNQYSASKSLPDLLIKEQEVGGEELTSLNDRLREVDTPSKTKRKTKSVKLSSKNQLTGQELEPEKGSGTERGSFHPPQILRTVDSTQVPSSDTVEGNSMGRPLQNDIDGNALKNCNMIDANNQIEVSKCDGDRVNFKDYFVPGEDKHEVAPVELADDKMSEAKRSDKEVKTKKNAKNLLVPFPATSYNLQNSPKSYVHPGSERKSHSKNSSSIPCQESLSKDEHNEVGFHSKSSKSVNGVKAPGSLHIKQIKTIPQETKQPDVFNGSKTGSSVRAFPKENSESSGAKGSSSEISDKYLQNKREIKRPSSFDRHHLTVSKASIKKMGEVVNSSQHKKSLLATPGAIFRDGDSESSEDENSSSEFSDNSDASTKTPSDNSSSSGYSEGESKSKLDSPRNGIYGAKGKYVEKSIVKSQALGPKNITMDMIFRSSSRFKKAKLTAAQSQLEDTESQPVDFVPDSQGNL